MKRIAIDMDEVMADTMAHFLEKYNQSFGVGLKTEHFQGRHVFEVIDEAHKPEARDYFQQEAFFATIPVLVEQPRDVSYELQASVAAAKARLPAIQRLK